MKIEPLGDRLLIRPDPTETRRASGLLIPDTAQERPLRGTVVAVGPGAAVATGERTPVEPRVGESVIYSKFGATEIVSDGEELILIHEKDVLIGEAAAA